MHPKEISIQDFTYTLPDERIAFFPLEERDASKLLVYQNGQITEDRYKNITGYIPEKSLLVFNNTRVIQARILFQKTTGGVIEIFCLEPYEALNEYSSIMAKREKVRWKCMIGGASKWKGGNLQKTVTHAIGQLTLTAQLVERLSDAYVVELSWQPASYSFSEIIELMGDTPLPPYIKRKAADEDKERYQTVYAKYDGSVAAPTAGLHFTPAIFTAFRAKNIACSYVTLHVGAGTFKPVKAQVMEGHEMHAEWIDVSADTLSKLMDNIGNGIIAAGTTSLRTIETLYWMGVKTILTPAIAIDDLVIRQWEVYEPHLANNAMASAAALSGLLSWMKKNNCERLVIPTQILIAPGYVFKVASALVTNFHQPQSTLLLLVAAAIGEEWKRVYQYAMEKDFRFLSYGDGSLLFFNQPPSGAV